MGPLRIGFSYGAIAALVGVVADLRFFLIDPASMTPWVLAVIETYRTSLALATCVFLGLLAALRVRPTRMDPGVPYRSLLLRDGALAATVVAVVFGGAVLLTTALQATVFAEAVRSYAGESAPRIVAYLDELAERFDNPSPATVEEVESDLQPPVPGDLGRSITNFVLRAILVGTLGCIVGLLRGRFGATPGGTPGGRDEAKPLRE